MKSDFTSGRKFPKFWTWREKLSREAPSKFPNSFAKLLIYSKNLLEIDMELRIFRFCNQAFFSSSACTPPQISVPYICIGIFSERRKYAAACESLSQCPGQSGHDRRSFKCSIYVSVSSFYFCERVFYQCRFASNLWEEINPRIFNSVRSLLPLRICGLELDYCLFFPIKNFV